MDNDIARDVCREMRLETMTDGEMLLKEGSELYRFYIILDGSVQVWNRSDRIGAASKELQCGGGLWSVAEVEFEAVVHQVKKITKAWPGGAEQDFSAETWQLMQNLDVIVRESFQLLQDGRLCMRNDLDLVLRQQDVMPDFGRDGKDLVKLLCSSLTLAEVVRKEYLGHETAVKMSGATKTIKGERVKMILDLSVKLQSVLTAKVQALAAVYRVQGSHSRNVSLRRAPSGTSADEGEDAMMHLTAELAAGYVIGNAIFKGEVQRCPATCTCKVKSVSLGKHEGKKGWGSIKVAKSKDQGVEQMEVRLRLPCICPL
jgi:hypothetical protein